VPTRRRCVGASLVVVELLVCYRPNRLTLAGSYDLPSGWLAVGYTVAVVTRPITLDCVEPSGAYTFSHTWSHEFHKVRVEGGEVVPLGSAGALSPVNTILESPDSLVED
jgi:hypothetical protein